VTGPSSRSRSTCEPPDDERVAGIVDAASEIGAVIGLGRDAWDKDRIRRLAVERLLEIIGEAPCKLTASPLARPRGYRRGDLESGLISAL